MKGSSIPELVFIISSIRTVCFKSVKVILSKVDRTREIWFTGSISRMSVIPNPYNVRESKNGLKYILRFLRLYYRWNVSTEESYLVQRVQVRENVKRGGLGPDQDTEWIILHVPYCDGLKTVN